VIDARRPEMRLAADLGHRGGGWSRFSTHLVETRAQVYARRRRGRSLEAGQGDRVVCEVRIPGSAITEQSARVFERGLTEVDKARSRERGGTAGCQSSSIWFKHAGTIEASSPVG